MVTALKVARCAASDVTKFTTTRLTGQQHRQSHRSGSLIWHDNTFLGTNSGSGNHTALPYYPVINAVSNDLSNWGFADGANGWDKNDPHGIYLSGTAASNTTIAGGGYLSLRELL